MALLLERAGETAEIARAIAGAMDGHGAALLIEGEAGIGKTALLARAREDARTRGMTVLGAVGTPLEGSVPFGLARQLLLPLVGAGAAGLSSGAAALAAPALGFGGRGEPPDPDAAFAAVHGLAWLVADLAERRGPLLLCLDDLHWADPASLRFAAAVATRAPELPVVLLTAARPSAAFDALRPLAAPLHPQRLSPEAVGAVLEAELGAAPAPAFVAAAHGHTGGLPFGVSGLAGALRREAVAPLEDQVARLRDIAPAEIGASVAARLGTASPAARALARATAIAGDGRSLGEVAALAEVPAPVAAEAVDELVIAGLLSPGPSPVFSHPLVAAAIRDSMGTPERLRLHALAAAAAAGAGDAERAAMHLLETPGTGDPAAVRLLGEAAAASLARGAPEEAASLLRRALSEPPSARQRPEVLFLLGQAELLTASHEAVGRLAEAAATLADPTTRLRAGTLRGHVLTFMGRFEEGFEAMAAALADAQDAPEDLRRLTDMERLFAMLTTRASAAPARAGITALPDKGSPVDRAYARGLKALAGATAGAPVADVAREAGAAVDVVPAVPLSTPLQTCPALALLYSDVMSTAARWLQANHDAARRRGHLRVLQLTGTWLAVLAMRDGRPRDASEASLDAHVPGTPTPALSRLVLSAVAADVALARGRLDEAAAAVTEPLEDEPVLAPVSFVPDLLVARARVRRAQGRAAEAVELTRQAGAQSEQWGAASPATNGWRAHLAFALRDCGRPEEAREAAEEEIAAARTMGSPRAEALALRAAAYAGADPAVAAAALEVARSGAPELDVARCELLGGRLALERGDAGPARELLRAAMDRSWRAGAEGVSEQARSALIAAGGRPRRPTLLGPAALTPAERRTIRLIAGGATNREAAETLYVTLGTVERHLTSAYRKLGVEGRGGLAAALDQ